MMHRRTWALAAALVLLGWAGSAAGIAISNTAAGTRLSNWAYIDGDNFGEQSAVAYTNVGTNFGGVWVGEDDKTDSAGQTVTITTYLTNHGNGWDIFTFSVTSTNTNPTAGADTGGKWTWDISLEDRVGGVTSVTCQYRQVRQINFEVLIGGTAQPDAWSRYVLRARSRNTSATCYTGDNGDRYGGTIGTNAAPGGPGYLMPSVGATTNVPWSWAVLVEGPDVTLIKEVIHVTNVAAGTTGIAYGGVLPGSTVTYRLIYTNNSATVDADNVLIRDSIDATYMEYVADSLRTNYGGLLATYPAAALAVTDDDGDDPGACNTNADIRFAPLPAATVDALDNTGTGVIPLGTRGCCFYQLTVR